MRTVVVVSILLFAALWASGGMAQETVTVCLRKTVGGEVDYGAGTARASEGEVWIDVPRYSRRDASGQYCPPPGCPAAVTLRARPEEGYRFDRWKHGHEESHEDTFTFIPQENGPDLVIAVFVAGEDMTKDLGLVAAARRALQAAIPEVDLDTFDGNGETGAAPSRNGIPDLAEIRMLEEVLARKGFSQAQRGGVSHTFVSRVWRENLARAKEDLDGRGFPAYLRDTVAAYATLGAGGSIRMAQYLLDQHATATGKEVPKLMRKVGEGDARRLAYTMYGANYFFDLANADMDNFSNAKEWQAAEAHAAEHPDRSVHELFVAYALGDLPTPE